VRWLAKAAVQGAVSVLPGSEKINYVFQRHVTHSVPAGNAVARRRFAKALAHMRVFDTHSGRSVSQATFYEFGAGWDLFSPLAYFSLGVDHQIVTDVAPHARVELVNASLGWLERWRTELEAEAERPLREVGERGVATLDEVRTRFGITYLAPRDAAATTLPAGSVDFVSSTATLEHVPEGDIFPILAECRRLLVPGGIASCRIDLHDHYAYFDRSISSYNFLKFSSRIWRLVNPPLAHQNRLRYRDYVRLFDEAGFEIVDADLLQPRPKDLDALRRLELDERFRRYSLKDLAVKAVHLVTRNPG
jgi:SAM-dependent methyltransferase